MELPDLPADAEGSVLEEALAFLESCDFGDLGVPRSVAEPVLECSGDCDALAIEPLTAFSRNEATLAMCGHKNEEVIESAAWNQQWQQEEVKPVVQPPLDTTPTSNPLGVASMLASTSPGSSFRPTQPAKRHGRAREQLIQLREMVKRLEVQLEGLKNHFRSGHGYGVKAEGEPKSQWCEVPRSTKNDASPSSTGAPSPATAESKGQWHQIATRQYHERCKAEQENAELKESLEKQIRVARRLENLLERQNLTDEVRRASLPLE